LHQAGERIPEAGGSSGAAPGRSRRRIPAAGRPTYSRSAAFVNLTSRLRLGAVRLARPNAQA